MLSNLPLAGKTIFLTGTQKVQTIASFIEMKGGKVATFPLIETKEIIADNDAKRMLLCNDYEWLIFTSQNAVSAFAAKLERVQVEAQQIHCKIAAVGEKTAQLLQKHGFYVNFMPSTYSADIFVQEFNESGRALFIRGNLAKPTITEGIGADEWTVYETLPTLAHIQAFKNALLKEQNPIVVFASPSAVHTYANEIVPTIDWQCVKVATIGHVTTRTLAEYGVEPVVQPKNYTMRAIIELLILEESKQP